MLAKRLFDFFGALFGLIVLSPLFFVVACAIRLDSTGPVFFRQVRTGIHGVPFRIFKFRTMITDAERKGMQITVGMDNRITSVGVFLRKFKIDELPQLINVVLGDMSLVGPRPEVPKYVAKWPDNVRDEILSVRPGITDFASIEFRDENALLADAEDPERVYVEKILPIKVDYYLQYVRHRCLLLDIQLIFRTLWAIAA